MSEVSFQPSGQPSGQPSVDKNPESIRKMFGAIASAYDPANTVLSFGIHKSWKKTLVRESGVQAGSRILDLATGTGDLAFEFDRYLGGKGDVTGADFCPEMLDVAKKKLADRASQGSLRFEIADAMSLPFADNSFDFASISFGIRNTRDPKKALSEMARVVKPGGTIAVLEFGKPRAPLMKLAFGWYSKKLLPKLGGWISGQPEAYRYLEKSSAEFPSGEDFIQLAHESAKFSETGFKTFQGGIAYLYRLKVSA
jgi:demethylmenaquinone methyltransferase/2-methoxy-6-polyprenyl-1,4-benzoquinol methylase